MGRPASNKTFIVVSGTPYVCKKRVVIGHYIYFSANPIPAILSKLSARNFKKNYDINLKKTSIGNSTYFNFKNNILKTNIYTESAIFKSINLSMIENFTEEYNSEITTCDVYENEDNNNIDIKMLYTRIKKNLIKAKSEGYGDITFSLNYNFDNVTNTYKYGLHQQCTCVYTNSDILFCKLLEKNEIFYLNIDKYSKILNKNTYEENFISIWNKIKEHNHPLFVKYKISSDSKMNLKYDYHKYINVYVNTKKANLEFYLKIISITKPFITKNDLLNFVKLFKFYTSSQNFGFLKLKKIRKKERQPFIKNDNYVSLLSSVYITLISLLFIGLIPSIIFFRQQRILALKKIVEIENHDYDCIKLECSIKNVCTKKELIQIQKVIRIENEIKKQMLVDKLQRKFK